MSIIYLNINGREVEGLKGQSILDIARKNKIEIPTMCHDERVKVYGSCGLCVVEVEGVGKLLRSCATEASDGMVIKTDTKRVEGSRKTALELLLSDHVGDCYAPCKRACPGDTDCQGYVGLIANGEFKEALKLIKEQLPLPASIGRVCPHPCEDACRRQLVEEAVSIAFLKSFVADIDLKNKEVFMPDMKPASGKRVAIIGGGPGGLSAAYFLLTKGHQVTIFDKMPEMGGMLRYGIPQYRLPKTVLDEEIEIIKNMGAEFKNNIRIGKDMGLDSIKRLYDAVYISIGAWKSSKLRVKGEESAGVLGGIEFLRKSYLNHDFHMGKRVAVIGGGNTALDACRTAIRLGAKDVYLIYRRTEKEMPAEDIEIKEAREEGVDFKFLSSPLEIVETEGRASKIILQKMKLGETDESGRRRPVAIKGEIEILDVDLVIGAIGQEADLKGFEKLTTTLKGTISVDDSSFRTNIDGVFAGGDVINKGADIAIKAIGDAKKASEIIDSYLEGQIIPYEAPYIVTRDKYMTEDSYKDRARENRGQMPHLLPKERKYTFQEVNLGLTVEEAIRDAKRCLECGCNDVFECKLFKYANEYKVEPEKYEGEVHLRQEDDKHLFIVRDSDKCILCGLCVRVCEEVMDNGALGLVDRGFDTIVKPALELPLAETDCISCGQCVTVCPVGAIQERLQLEKPVAIETRETETICSFCSLGCNIRLQTRGRMIYRALSNADSLVDRGLLCVKGRFGYDQSQKKTRLTTPLIRKDGKLVESSWKEALSLGAKSLQSIRLKHGKDSIALSISDRYTNEDIYIANQFAKEYLMTENIGCFNKRYSGLKDVLGYDASTNSFKELEQSEFILVIGSDMMKDHTIGALKVKKAVDKGGRLVLINDFSSHLDQWASLKINPENDLSILKEILKAIIDLGFTPENVIGFEQLKRSLAHIDPREEAREVARLYTSSKSAMIVFEQNYITSDAAKLIANMAVVSGQIGKARRGIIQLKAKNNSQGLADMGVNTDSKYIKELIHQEKLKGLMVLGEDLEDIDLENLEFLVVQDLYLTDTAKKAHIVLPASSYAESKGTFTSSERRIQRLNQAIPPMVQYENWQIINEMMYILGRVKKYANVEEITEKLSQNREEYFGVASMVKSGHWPLEGSPILYENGFNFQDKRARLALVGEGKLFHRLDSTDYIEKEFEKNLLHIK